VHRYKILGYECRAQIPATGDACRTILTKAGITGYEVGHTKVFLRYFHVDQLNAKLKPYNGAAALISKYARGIAARVGFARRLADKREQDRRVEALCTAMERAATGAREVFHALVEEDAKRPADYWAKKAAPPPPEPKGVNDASNSAKVKRAASVKWFKEVEKKKGNGMAGGKFAKWFHGIITRQESEDLLRSKQSGTFLIRVAESRFGYSLSLIHKGRCKHFMIDQDKQGRYIVVGNDRTFPSLNDIVAYHEKQQVTDEGDCLLYACEGLGDRADLKELM
jgi:myosin-3